MKDGPITRRLVCRGTVVAESVEVATCLRKRLRGLLGCSGLPTGYAMFLSPCMAVHTFFMRFPLDLVFVDRQMIVVKIVAGVRPFRVVFGGFRAFGVLEAGTGWISHTGLRVGDQLEWWESWRGSFYSADS